MVVITVRVLITDPIRSSFFLDTGHVVRVVTLLKNTINLEVARQGGFPIATA